MKKLILTLSVAAGLAAHGELTWKFSVNADKATATLTGVTATDEAELKGALTLPSTQTSNGTQYKVTGVGANAFQSLAITSLVIPDSIASIGGGAFAGCTSLETLVMGNGVTAIGGNNTTAIDTSDYDGYASYGAFGGCLSLKTVRFSERLLSIGNQSFAECRALEEVTLPDSLQSIGVQCFYHAKALTRASFGTKLETVGLYAFAACPELQAVTFRPAETPLLSIGSYAFSSNPSLASLTLSGSLKEMGSYAFASCPLLRKITIPSVVASLANNAFSGMANLKEVVFMGLPPENLANAGLAKDVKIRYNGDWAEDWEAAVATCGFTNASAYSSGGTGTGGGEVVAGALTLTVTNVVVHYVSQSLPSTAVVPSTTVGIVNIISEVEAGKAVAITSDWADQYAGFAEKFGTDFSKALTAETGKRDGAGNPMLVWQDFVAGTDPTDADDVFTVSITFDKVTGAPVISWTPELPAAEAAKRVYRTFGKVRLTDSDWTEVNGNAADFNFFKVSVSMK